MLTIRPFRYSDVDALAKIGNVSFADEFIARGLTPEALMQQIRLITRGRMIPFRLLTAIAGMEWQLLVAEVDGKVVGCGGYVGRKQMELVNLMVLPEYRRQGVGQALLLKRIEQLQTKGYPLVTTTILSSNEASLGNVQKQGFVVFDQYVILEKKLPFETSLNSIATRPIRPADLSVFQEIEKESVSATRLEIQGSTALDYFPSLGSRLLNRLTGTVESRIAFTDEGLVVGFMRATTSRNQTKGVVSRPIIRPEYRYQLPAMLNVAGHWLSQLGKSAIQAAVTSDQSEQIQNLEAEGWVQTQSWLRLVKWLNPEAAKPLEEKQPR